MINVEVVLFPDRNNPSLMVVSPKFEIEGFVEKPNAQYEAFGARKFIVLRDDEPSRIVLAIGPELRLFHRGYYHKDIYRLSKQNFENLKISGGGKLEFYPSYGDLSKIARIKLFDSSGDYGLPDAYILVDEVRNSIADALGVVVMFEFSYYSQPESQPN